MIPITINDQCLEISSDLSILDVARENGLHISMLCYREAMELVDAFRLFRGGREKSSQGWSMSIGF